MELLYSNYANTTTQFSVNGGTGTTANIMNPDQRFQFASDNAGTDSTTTTMVIAFDATTTISRIALAGHNLKAFRVFYGGATANTFALTTSALSSPNTTVSAYSSNSDTSHYFVCTPVDCTSISIDMISTIDANQEKAVGYLVLSDIRTDFDKRIPPAQNYNPTLDPHNIYHRLSDGGVRLHTIDQKWRVSFGLNYIDETLRDELKDIYDDHQEMIFCPFGTTTGWDSVIFPCVWNGNFDFFKYSDNAAASGYSGSFEFLQTPT